MTTQLIFLLPRINSDFFAMEALLRRQNLYASLLKDIQEGAFQKALLIYSGDEVDKETTNFECLEIKRVGSAQIGTLGFALKATRLLRKLTSREVLLVAGTPFQPLLAARMIKLFLPHVKIQVSIHGELAGLRVRKSKSFFFRTQIRHVDAIRFVSDLQRETILREYKISRIPNVVTPVPIELPASVSNGERPSSIGFVGRIHTERDPMLWAEISSQFPEFKKVVVGDGPMRALLEAKLLHAHFLGRLEGEFLEASWAQIGILLSTAPYESYGLALREALLNGVPVVARRSAGVVDLAQAFPNLIKVFNSKDEAVNQISEFLNYPPKLEEFTQFRNWFAAKQITSLQSLASLWNALGN